MNGTIYLKPGRDKSLRNRHPWIFSGAIKQLQGQIKPGETVEIMSSQGEWLARGAYSPYSQICARVWTWESSELVDDQHFYHRLSHAFEHRRLLSDLSTTNAYRLVHGESDGLPGLIIDIYGDIAVIQFLAVGVEYWRSVILDSLRSIVNVRSIYERSDVNLRKLEGLDIRAGLLWGETILEPVIIRENDCSFYVDIVTGHKTGFYLDQRENRLKIRQYTHGKDVLDCFCYTGGFTINALLGEPKSIVAADISPDALDLAKKNLVLNKYQELRVDFENADIFQLLRTYRDKSTKFDTIILDPPKFAQTKYQVQKAARGYKDINLLAMKLLREHGILITFSCSGGMTDELFQKILFSASIDAGVGMQIIGHLHQGADHPIAINFPEGEYLKGYILRRM
jgi:23S rRNA (cytosine1962-C5)-methyltransferase